VRSLQLDGVSPAPEIENEGLPKFTQMVQHLSIDIKRPEGAQHREPSLLNVGGRSECRGSVMSLTFYIIRSGSHLKIRLHQMDLALRARERRLQTFK